MTPDGESQNQPEGSNTQKPEDSENNPKLQRPQMLRFYSTPVIGNNNTMSPTRQQFRLGNTKPREIKETLDAKYRSGKFGQTDVINQYVLKNNVAKSSFGSVRVAIDDKTKVKYAVKEYSKVQLQKASRAALMRRRRRMNSNSKESAIENDFSPLGLVRHEVAIMKKLDHPNIVSLVEVLDDPHGDELYMILEWCEKGSILKSDHQGESPYTEEQCRLIFRDVILAIEYLHSQNVIHRDIKADNILMDEDDVVKIVDFGVSEIFEQDNDEIKKTAGSPAYMAPELARLSNGTNIDQVQKIAGRPADIWSLGVVLYYILTGKLPFVASTVVELFDSIINNPVDLSMISDSDLKDLLSQLLEKDALKRIKMEELRQHPWVTCNGQDLLLSTEENTGNAMVSITEDDLFCAFEQIKGMMDQNQASDKLKRLHGWRGTTMKSRDPSPPDGSTTDPIPTTTTTDTSSTNETPERTKTPPIEVENLSRLSRALDEIINKRSVSNPGRRSPHTVSGSRHSPSDKINEQNEQQQQPEKKHERRRSRSRTREETNILLQITPMDRSQSLEPSTKL